MLENDVITLVIGYLPFLLLSSLRMYIAWSFLPLLGPHVLGPAMIRNVLILAFSIPICFHSQALFASATEQMSAGECASAIFTEVVVGSIIGFVATIPFWALDMGCYLMDTLRGSSMSALLNPLLGSSSSVLGLFFSQIIAVLFLSFGGLFALLRTLYQSYQVIPFGSRISFNLSFLALLQEQWRFLSTLGLSFALPAIIMMIMIDCALGLLNRATRQLNVFFIAMPIKSLMTLFLLAVGLEFATVDYVNEMERLPRKVLPLLRASHGRKD